MVFHAALFSVATALDVDPSVLDTTHLNLFSAASRLTDIVAMLESI
jgi:hypothetical protein